MPHARRGSGRIAEPPEKLSARPRGKTPKPAPETVPAKPSLKAPSLKTGATKEEKAPKAAAKPVPPAKPEPSAKKGKARH